MYGKVILVFCAQVVLIESTWRTCHRGVTYPALTGFAVGATPTNGGILPVASASAFSPELKIASENEYEGTLSVDGELPFIGTVELEGVVPSAGKGFVQHACGNGPAKITSTNFEPFSNTAISASNALAKSVVGVIPQVISSDFDYRNDMERVSRFGYFGFNENAFGGKGEGNVAAFGQLPVAGEAVVAGQVPIMGSVNYGGPVPASGSVSISGMCNCDDTYF